MSGDTKESSATELDLPIDYDPLAPLTNATKAGTAELLSYARMVGAEIIRLDASAAPTTQSQHVRFRVRGIIVNGVTAQTMSLVIGTASYPFESAARGIAFVPFPLVIERGADMSCTGADGRIYLIGDPE